jgi:ATP/maltotriose-dependent transcriptional regulator MalT/DNA-binding SARP family transcriptional activator
LDRSFPAESSPASGSLVARLDLQRQLQAGLTRRLTLIVAPAGYGKTTLLRQWLQSIPSTLPRVWYSLEDADNNPAHFVGEIYAQVCAALPAGERLPEVDENQESLSFPLSIIFRKAAELSHSDWLLLLDDYQCITNPAIQQALEALLNLPTWPVHLVIASRTQPVPAAAARLRVEGRLVELDERELRFNPGEILSLFEAAGLPLEEAQVARLAERTEGWPAALRMVCQATSAKGAAGKDMEHLLEHMGTQNAMFDYLAGQVLNAQPEPVRKFLCRSALLPYLSASLCDAFLDASDSSAILDNLCRAHLFIACYAEDPDPLYHYHGLFAEFLRGCLEREEGSRVVRDLHRRAALCLLQRQSGERASRIAVLTAVIPHWIAAGEPDEAAQAIESVAELLDWGQLTVLKKWLEALPAGLAEERPRLLLVLGLLREKEGRWNEALAALEQAGRLLAAGNPASDLLARVRVRQAWVYHREGQYERAAGLCRQALETLDTSASKDGALSSVVHEQAEVHLLLAANNFETGHLEQSLQAGEQALALFRATGDTIGEARAVSQLADVFGSRGSFIEYIQAEQSALRLYDELGSFRASSSLLGLADAYRQLAQYDLAREALERVLRLLDANPDPLARGYALFLLGHWQRERGERAPARSSYDEALALGEKLREPTILGETRRGLALLALDEGNLREAFAQAEAALKQMRAVGHRLMEGQALITLGLVQDRSGDAVQSEASFMQARQLFTSLQDAFAQANIHLYLADLQRRIGRLAEAGENFSRCLSLSARYGYDSLFILRERPRALPLLVAALAELLPPALAAEVERLLELIAAPAVEPLLELLQSAHTSLPLQQRIIDLLGKIGDERAIPVLNRLSRKRVLNGTCLTALRLIAAQPAPALQIYSLGEFSVLRGGLPLPAAAWQPRRKTRLLLLYLLAHGLRPVSRDELLEVLWPDLQPASASLALNTTFSDLRRLLEPFLAKSMPSHYLLRDGDCFGLNPNGTIWYDVQAFEQAVRAGAASLRTALELYKGDFLLEEPYQEWAVRERERLRSLYLNLMVSMLEKQAFQGAWHEGVELARRILELEPWLEEVWRLEMTCLSMLGRRGEALQVFVAGERSLKQELGVEPSAETRALFEQLKA